MANLSSTGPVLDALGVIIAAQNMQSYLKPERYEKGITPIRVLVIKWSIVRNAIIV
jgi:hypothetical protein